MQEAEPAKHTSRKKQVIARKKKTEEKTGFSKNNEGNQQKSAL
jgi:hypothetical protein